jgi:DNA-binding PadR family transcriptional regulator
MADISAFAGVSIGPGTLYTAITRLVEKELIAPESSLGRQRPYRLTAEGTAALSEQLDTMRRLATVVSGVWGVVGAGLGRWIGQSRRPATSS